MKLYLKNITFILCLYGMVCFVSCTETKQNTKNEYVDIMKSDVLTDEALKKSWGLMVQGQQLADNGKNRDEIIQSFPKGTLFSTNSNSILFFIEGSIPMIIELDKNSKQKRQYKGNSGNSVLIPKISSPKSLAIRPLATSFSNDDKLIDVIASEKGDDERQQKKALIIAPFNSTDFKGNDDADVAYKYLKANRNFKNNILFRRENITLEDFTSFDKYDLVHLSTHGKNYCEVDKINYNDDGEVEWIDIASTGCFSLIATGIYHGFDNLEDEKQLAEFNLRYSKYLGAIYASSTRIYLKPLFFNYFYKTGITNNVEIEGGLKDKIWVFSACELGQNGMARLIMEDILEDSHFFNWTNSVEYLPSVVAFNEFYNNLIVKGLDATKSFDEVPTELRKNIPMTEDYKIKVKDTIYSIDLVSKERFFKIVYKDTTITKETTTSLLHLQTGEPRHGIEVIDMLNPTNNTLVQTSDFYELVGDFNDGNDEALTLKVKLIGYTKEEFLEKQMSISLEVDDESVLSKHSFLPDVTGDNSTAEFIQEHKYGVLVTITDIAIPDVGTKEELTLKAILHLNDEHISIHKETVSIVSYGILATTERRGRKSKFTYDGKRKTGKYQLGSLPVVYHDDQGYKYVNSNGSGWKKVNMRKMTGTNSNIDSRTRTLLNFPLAGYALIFKINEFEKTKEYKKTKVNCGLPVKCSEFSTSSGVVALFNPSGKLIKFKTPSQTINFKYGNYEVILPEAGIPKKVKKIENVISGIETVKK